MRMIEPGVGEPDGHWVRNVRDPSDGCTGEPVMALREGELLTGPANLAALAYTAAGVGGIQGDKGSTKKRGDHLFANGPKKLPDEIRASAPRLPKRIAERFSKAADDLDRLFEDSAFSETLHKKGATPLEGDAQSQSFGRAIDDFRNKHENFVNATEDVASAPKADLPNAKDGLKRAGDELNESWGRVLDQAEDTEATRLADKKTVESGRKTLEEARDVVARMTNDVGNAL